MGCVNLTLPLVLGFGLLRACREHESRASFYARDWQCRFPKIKMKDKYDELRAAIAAVRKVNADFLEILPARRCDDEGVVATQVAAFFRDHGQEAEEAIAAFLDARAVFL